MSTNITKLSGAYLSNQINVNPVSQNGKVSDNKDASFSSFLKSDTQDVSAKVDNKAADLKAAKSDNDSDATKALDETKKPIKDASKNAQTDEKKTLDDVKEEIDDASKEVFDAIKEETGVSDEELIAAMEVLNLTMADLLDVSKVTELFLEIKGADSAQLLTDEALLGDLNDLIATVDTIDASLLEKLSMTKEEFDLALDEATKEAVKLNEEGVDTLTAVVDQPKEEAREVEQAPTVLASDKNVTGDTNAKISETNNNEEANVQDNVTINVQRREDKGTDNHENAFANSNQNNNFDFVEKLDETMNTTSYASQSAREIVNQIVDQIKIDISNESSRMEFELNPASLGHVGLTIEARAGVITASFTAQNEMVKEAIESQIVQLRENIEAQGVKIEAVEVTLASHAFEQNLQQNNKGASEEEERNNGARAARRLRVNLDEIDEEELTDGEKITKEMMDAQGNTVNVTA